VQNVRPRRPAIQADDQITLGERASAILRFVDECVYRAKVSDPVF
jgi:hypothetical protein